MTVYSSDDCCEWDSEKDILNKNKHHLSFETASKVFYDPLEKKAYENYLQTFRWTTSGTPVDYTDIPQTTDFSKARLKYYTVKPVKQSITIRIDADLLAVLKNYGKGYQVKINDILRAVVMEHRMPVLE